MTSSDQPRSVLCLGLNDSDRSRVSEEAHRFGWLIRFAASAADARATGNGKRPQLVLFDVQSADDTASEVVRQCTAHPLLPVSHTAPTTPVPIVSGAPQGTEPTPVDDGTVLLEAGSIRRFEDYEQKILKHALETTNWNVKRAAQLLGIGRATLYRKIDRYKLREFQPERNAG
ncbi:MAG: helix-turn-helix domain-containing protein [Planctomycetota bacterium]|nr:helix-turn-helix domain-containing protein [Planctomycetota bacterium]MDG1983241.1 helix-turn-helix domain-containing protein [Planctomycetota bacterium]